MNEFQKKRLNGLDEIEKLMNEISPLVSNAKNETIELYSGNAGSYDITQPIEMVLSYLKRGKTTFNRKIMKKTLQDQYLLIKEGKGHKGVFLTEAKRQFPNIVRNAATFEEAAASLITKNIITENIIGLTAINSPFEPKKKESYELAFENFLAEAKKKENEDEKVKAEEKKVSKPVEEDAHITLIIQMKKILIT
jgi:hypothetical protein